MLVARELNAGSLDQSIRIWSPEAHSRVAKPERADTTLTGHTSTITHLAWKPGQQHDVLLSTTGGEKSDKTIRSGIASIAGPHTATSCK